MEDIENTPGQNSDHFRRGIGRASYFGFSFLLLMILGFVEAASGPELGGGAAGVTLVLVIVGLFLGAARYTNIGYSPWLILLGLIPLVNIFIGYQCLALPPGYANTKAWDLPMKIVTGIYVLFALFVVFAILAA